MPFYADLHLHSRFARATSRNADLAELAWWARRKGVAVLERVMAYPPAMIHCCS